MDVVGVAKTALTVNEERAQLNLLEVHNLATRYSHQGAKNNRPILPLCNPMFSEIHTTIQSSMSVSLTLRKLRISCSVPRSNFHLH